MILVADCSALIALACCEGLPLLDALFGVVVVPDAVYREAVVGDKPEARQLKDYLQDKIRKIDPSHAVLLDTRCSTFSRGDEGRLMRYGDGS